jgi:hypothetical protein
MLVQICRIAFHTRGYVPVRELRETLVPQARLLGDDLADKERPLPEDAKKRGALG